MTISASMTPHSEHCHWETNKYKLLARNNRRLMKCLPQRLRIRNSSIYVRLGCLRVDSNPQTLVLPSNPLNEPPTVFMSSTGQATSSSNVQLIVDALADYAKQTGIDLTRYPIAEKIELSTSPGAILELLQERESSFERYREVDWRLIGCFSPAVKVLYAFSGILGNDGEAVSLVSAIYYPVIFLTWSRQIPSSPVNAVFTSIDVLLAVRPLNTLNQVLVTQYYARLLVMSPQVTRLFLNSLNAWRIFSSVLRYTR